MRVPALTFACVLAAVPAAAVEDYDGCVALIAADALRAVEEATGWATFGGGAPARHCRALALLATGADGQAAQELLDIAAEEADLAPPARAAVLAQAGEILLDAGKLATAQRVSAQALALAPSDPDALALAAGLRLAEGNAVEARRMADAALGAWGAVPLPRLLILRAAAARAQGDLATAREDTQEATQLAPAMASAWLERGRVAARIGDRTDARSALLRAVELDRDGRLGAQARTAIQRLEAGIAE